MLTALLAFAFAVGFVALITEPLVDLVPTRLWNALGIGDEQLDQQQEDTHGSHR